MQIKTVTELLQSCIVKCFAKSFKVDKLFLIRLYCIIDRCDDRIFVETFVLCMIQALVA